MSAADTLTELRLLRRAVRLVSQDMHNTSRRPCSTCSTVSKALGEPFGCDAYRLSFKTMPAASRKNGA